MLFPPERTRYSTFKLSGDHIAILSVIPKYFIYSVILALIFLFVIIICGCSVDNSNNKNRLLNSKNSVSSPINISPDGKIIWVVNPDANSVTAIDAHTLEKQREIKVGREPWSIAVSTDKVAVVNRKDGALTLITDKKNQTIHLGSEPGGVALSPTGKFAYITLSSENRIVKVDLEKLQVISDIKVGSYPWQIAVSNDGDLEDSDETIIITHRFSRETQDGERRSWLTIIRPDKSQQELPLPSYKFGFANVLDSLAIGKNSVYITHLLDNPDLPRDFKNTISGGVSTLFFGQSLSIKPKGVDLNDEQFSTSTNFPRAIAVSSDEKRVYVVLAGSNSVMGINQSKPDSPKLIGFWPVGDNPRGIVLSKDEKQAFVMNYLSRSISVIDLNDEVRRKEVKVINTTNETLSPTMLAGKKLFNNASSPKLSHMSWLSCASCHIDGGVDGVTWITPDGPRQTMPLWNLSGTEPLHASATRDEVQDFEEDIEMFLKGVGLAYGRVKPLLGVPNSGKSKDLDALAHFVLNGIRPPSAPQIHINQLEIGRSLFKTLGCIKCHRGKNWTLSQLPNEVGKNSPNGEKQIFSVLRNVGTLNKGDLLGKNGFDIPTLMGLFATEPYLHDGSAKTIPDVLKNKTHVGRQLTEKETVDLFVFLFHIDESTIPF